MPKLCQIAAMSILVACVVNASPKEIPSNEVIQLSAIEVNHPFCQSETFIETGQETFTAIANDLPGRKEYNELIRTFHRGQWDKLDASMELFESEFEDSPLREAVAFLKVQSLFDRLTNSNSPRIHEAEKSLREALLLYPRSKLIPTIQATVGAFWLKNGMYAQSLALFTAAKQEHPFHPFYCLFQFGIAENNYLLNEHEAAKKSFRAVIQKCNNPRLVTGAKLRLVELEFNRNPKESGADLERLYLSESHIVTRFYPGTLYNLGEFKFKQKEFKSSRFFFTEYLNSKKKDPDCAPYAVKRLGDIGIKTKAAIADILSSYLQTYDQYPKSDIGKYAYIQAMLMNYSEKSSAERQRRTQVIDEKLETIQDPKVRHVAALSKGLAVLDSSEKGAVDYLVNLVKANPQELKTPELSQFISSRLFKIIKKESETALSMGYQNESLKDEELFQPIQKAYDLWLKGSSFEKATRELYGELVKTRFSELFEKQKWSRAFETIDQWKESSLWPEKDKLRLYSHSIGVKLTQKIMDLESEAKTPLFQSLIENEDTMSEFLGADFLPLFVSAYHHSIIRLN